MKKKIGPGGCASYTDVGGREVNEDSIGVFDNGENRCYILCDGLGGHGLGDVASSLVVDVFGDQFSKSDDMVNFSGQAFTAAQEILTCEQKARCAKDKMKTTAVVAVKDDRNVYIGHIGDSRAYVFYKNKVRFRTLDHSIPQMLAISGEIRESEIRNHPDRNMLLRVLGIEWDGPMYELSIPIPLKKCQALLLCSDGFWELIDENTMCDLLKRSGSVDEWLEKMKTTVKTNGAEKNMDNNSAIAVWFE